MGVLVGGTAFAQAIAVLALPLLTRLYTPDDFSVLAVYAALLGIISVVACLRLEIAIPMPNIPEMDVMWTVVSNLLTDVNLSGEDVDAAFDEALSEAESLIANMQ